MIRINLLGVPRQKRVKAAASIDFAQKTPLACGLVLLLATGLIGLWYWSLARESAQLDADIAAIQQQAVQLRPVLLEVQQFEQRRAQLQQRVSIIEQLRGGQSVPVQLLDHVSRSVPDMLWLTQIDQQKNEMTIEGRSTTLIALSDFVGNLGSSSLLKKPIEIVSSQVEAVGASGAGSGSVEVIKFTVKAQLAAAMQPATAQATAGGGNRR